MDTILRDALATGSGPKYRRIAAGITQAIHGGALAAGDRLPPVRELAWRLSVTPGTVARAFCVLNDEGWVEAEVGRGTFVRGVPPASGTTRGTTRGTGMGTGTGTGMGTDWGTDMGTDMGTDLGTGPGAGTHARVNTGVSAGVSPSRGAGRGAGRGTEPGPIAGQGVEAADLRSAAARSAPSSGLGAPLFPEYPKEGDALFSPRLPDLGQIELVREGLMHAARQPVDALLAYPTFPSHAALRAAVMRWLPADMQGAVEPDHVVMTNGGQNAILIVLQTLLLDAPPVLLVEEHSYPGVRRAAELLRVRVVPVAMDADGVLPDQLDRLAGAENARIFFTMPEAHNPTATVTSPERRAAVAEVARRHALHVVQDDCYRLGPPTGPSYRAILPELGWYVSSLSKSLTPALRVGFAAAPLSMPARLRRVVDTNFFGLSRPISDAAAHVLSHPDTPRYVIAMRDHMRAYVEDAVNLLGRFDIGWDPGVPFIWLRLPSGWREGRFVQALEAAGIRVRPGDDFAARDASREHAVRISVNGQMARDDFRAVIGRIADILDHPPERAEV